MFRTWIRVSISGGSPKTDRQTLLMSVQAHFRPPIQTPQNWQKHDMSIKVGWCCLWMSMVGIYGCGWMQWDTNEGLGTERRQG